MKKTLLLSLTVLGSVLTYAAWNLWSEVQRAGSEDPLVWETAIDAFDASAATAPRNAVVFTGSSSIRLWHSLKDDMAPIPVVQRGFGGAKLNDVVHYAERLVNQYQPRAVVMFAGTNDITPGNTKSAATLLASYKEFVAMVRADFEALPIYYIAITPTPLRWEVWPEAKQVNALIAGWSSSQEQLFVIDTGAKLMAADGSPDPGNYRLDKLHLSDKGYAIWSNIIRQRLLSDFPDWNP